MPEVRLTNNDPPIQPKDALLNAFSSYWTTITGENITKILVGDWSPEDGELTTVQCVSSSLIKIDRSGGYLILVLLVRNIQPMDEDASPKDSVFNNVFWNLQKDKKITASGKDFIFTSGEFNSPVRVNGGSGINGFYDSGLLEVENTITTSALFTFNLYE